MDSYCATETSPVTACPREGRGAAPVRTQNRVPRCRRDGVAPCRQIMYLSLSPAVPVALFTSLYCTMYDHTARLYVHTANRPVVGSAGHKQSAQSCITLSMRSSHLPTSVTQE